jgi:hypothetical protein
MASLMPRALPPRFTLGPPVTDSRGQEATNPPRATLGCSGSLSLIVELFPWGSGETLRLVNPPPAIGRLRLQAAKVRSGLKRRMFESIFIGCNATQIRLFTSSVDVRCGRDENSTLFSALPSSYDSPKILSNVFVSIASKALSACYAGSTRRLTICVSCLVLIPKNEALLGRISDVYFCSWTRLLPHVATLVSCASWKMYHYAAYATTSAAPDHIQQPG